MRGLARRPRGEVWDHVNPEQSRGRRLTCGAWLDGRVGASGFVVVEDRRKGRVWVASIRRADGTRTRRTLGPAWVRDGGKRTARGAVVWRTAPGSKPDGYLTPADADEQLRELLRVASKSAAPRAAGRSWGDAADAWIDHTRTVKGREGTTLAGYESSIARLDAEGLVGRAWPLGRVTARVCEDAQEAMLRAGKLSRSTVYGRMFAIRAVLTHAAKQGWTDVSGVEILPAPRPHPDFNVLEPSQVEAIARAVEQIPASEWPVVRGPRIGPANVHEGTLSVMRTRRAVWAAVIRFAAYTGLRLGEIRGLEWRDVNISGEVVVVSGNRPSSGPVVVDRKMPKGKTGRSVPLIEPAIVALDTVSKLGFPTGTRDLVFPSGSGGPLTSKAVRQAFYGALDAAGLSHLRDGPTPIVFHDLRHTFASIAVRVFPVTDVQAMLGHADLKTTQRYVHAVPRHDAAAKLTAAFGRDLNAPAVTHRTGDGGLNLAADEHDTAPHAD